MAEFDEKAATWDDDPIRLKRAESIANNLAKTIDLTQINSSLEYGSGTGLLSFSLKNHLNNVVLMDESAAMTEVAKEKCQKLKNVHFEPIQYDLLKQPLPQKRFDLIYTMLTLHHIVDLKGILEKFSRLLNKGGLLVIIDLEKEDGSFHDGEFHGHLGFDRSALEANLIACGLKPRSYEICYTLEKDTATGTKQYPLFLLVAQKPK